ncbi:MAG: class I SAM-dependent methyltransferase [Chloroflexi bacterium]|nr:class I SAM-dependent methyltransferase [Chloroflexota bacterium]MBU1747585.1 class I SAM-dependent methyltransferase [Chloroflexota bacterium]
MPRPSDELDRYDLTCQRLREALLGQLPASVDLAATVTAHAYWACVAVSRDGTDWEQALRDYTILAQQQAVAESEAERREIALLRRELAQTRGPVLDVGAGWGRLVPLYAGLNRPAVYVEPATLGVQLMRRSGLNRVVQSGGETLPLADSAFAVAVIGWVLHHHAAPDVDAPAILAQAARVLAPGGQLLSIEPLGENFCQTEWTSLLSEAGFHINRVEWFFTSEPASGKTERYTLAVGTRGVD